MTTENEWEFGTVPKYSNFEQNEDLDQSAYFKTANLHTPMRAPLPSAREDIDPRDCGPLDFDLLSEEKENALTSQPPSTDKSQPQTRPSASNIDIHEKVETMTDRLSNLALFNPSGSRLAEKVRRRSKQIQIEPTAAAPTKPIRSSIQNKPAASTVTRPQPSKVQVLLPPVSTRVLRSRTTATVPPAATATTPIRNQTVSSRAIEAANRLSALRKREPSSTNLKAPQTPVTRTLGNRQNSMTKVASKVVPPSSSLRRSVATVSTPSKAQPLSARVLAAAERLSCPRKREPSSTNLKATTTPSVVAAPTRVLRSNQNPPTKTTATPTVIRRSSVKEPSTTVKLPPVSARARAAAERLSAPKKR